MCGERLLSSPLLSVPQHHANAPLVSSARGHSGDACALAIRNGSAPGRLEEPGLRMNRKREGTRMLLKSSVKWVHHRQLLRTRPEPPAGIRRVPQ